MQPELWELAQRLFKGQAAFDVDQALCDAQQRQQPSRPAADDGAPLVSNDVRPMSDELGNHLAGHVACGDAAFDQLLRDWPQEAIVHSLSGRGALGGLVVDSSGPPSLFATSQPLENSTVQRQIARHTEREFEELPMDSGFRFQANDAVTVIAGNDDERLADLMHSWDWSAARRVVLLFCSSGTHQRERRSHIESISGTICRAMSQPGVVVGSRLPVLMSEAARFAKFVLSDENRGRLLASVVAEYLHSTKRFDGRGLLQPWVIYT